ncbi:MATE family efflux transporter [Sulfurimonas sp. HSL3-7]|uniref:MATE family efflux transporter n=1 Tax=Sulfonitrofixus jiaomeiensis TaxID=3131938 RepID=UPI0031F9F4CC
MSKRTHLREVLGLALPAAFKHLLDILQLLIDMIMVGMLNVAALAAVGMSMQFMMVINVVMTLYIVGGNAVIARLIGERRRHRASALLYSLGLFALLLSLPISLFGFLNAENFYLWMGAEAELAEFGRDYFGILMLGLPLIFLDALMYNALSAAGDTTSSLYIKIFSAMINLLFNYLLIFGHGGFDAMGIAGAAYATIIAYGFNLLIYLFLLARKDAKLHLIYHFTKADLIRALHVGKHASLERLISVSSFILFVGVITAYGTAAIAGYQVGLRIEGLAFMPGFGFAIAATALVGQNLGAKKYEAAYQTGLYATKVAIFLMGFLGLVMALFPAFFIGFFTQDSATIASASIYLQLVGISQVPLAMTFVINGALRGAGATKTTLLVNVLSLWLLRVIPSVILYYLGFELIWIFIAMTVETFIKGAIFWYIYRQRKWQEVKV